LGVICQVEAEKDNTNAGEDQVSSWAKSECKNTCNCKNESNNKQNWAKNGKIILGSGSINSDSNGHSCCQSSSLYDALSGVSHANQSDDVTDANSEHTKEDVVGWDLLIKSTAHQSTDRAQIGYQNHHIEGSVH
jgi:hypothetical protein